MDLAMVSVRLSGLATVHLEPMRRTSVLSLLRKLDENHFFSSRQLEREVGGFLSLYAWCHLCNNDIGCLHVS